MALRTHKAIFFIAYKFDYDSIDNISPLVLFEFDVIFLQHTMLHNTYTLFLIAFY